MKFEVNLSVYEKGKKRPEYTIDSDLNGEVTLIDLLKWTKTSLIVIADEVLKEEQAAGFDKFPVLTVDGRKGKPIEAVSPLGKIEFTSRSSVNDILLAAYEGVLFRSKVLTGLYKSSHFVFLNGTQIASDLNSLNAWLKTSPEIKDKDIIRIVNIQPYARKLERFGITAQKSSTRYSHRKEHKDKGRGKMLVQVPNGTYYLTARAVKSKFKRNVGIRFAFIPGSSLGLKGSFKGGRKGKNSAGRPYLYPSIVITINERGIINE